MHQTVLTLVAEVLPARLGHLRAMVAQLRAAIETKDLKPSLAYEALSRAVPALHFASVMVFEDERYDPVLTIELNFDGDAGPFLPQLDAPDLQPHLREIVKCCKRPPGPAGNLYDAATDPGSERSLAPLLESMIVRPAVFHQGNRGLDRARIARESDLFDAVQVALRDPALYRADKASNLHAALRGRLVGPFPWLAEADAPRIPGRERARDIGALVGFVYLVILALSVPGLILALILPFWDAIAVCLGLSVLAGIGLKRADAAPRTASPPAPPRAKQLPVLPPPTPFQRLALPAGAVAGLVAYVLVGALVVSLPFMLWHLGDPSRFYAAAVRVVIVGLAGAVLSVLVILWRVRVIENSDFVQDDPIDDPERLARIAAAEDQIAQNHMGSLVHVKPGALRAVVLRFGLTGLGLLLRVVANDGYLGSMRTIHFAHWAIIGNEGRLLFFSNFDSSWESYLDDFIEKAHAGLTLAWTNGVGFPRTRFLVGEGATNGSRFKAWARHSMSENLFWFSAYRKLSVNQIERQYRVAAGLRKARFPSEQEALTWAQDL